MLLISQGVFAMLRFFTLHFAQMCQFMQSESFISWVLCCLLIVDTDTSAKPNYVIPDEFDFK